MINSVTLSGYLITGIEIKKEEGEVIACSCIAVHEKNGKWQDPNANTLLIDLVFRIDLIAFACDNLHGGSKIFVEGRLEEKNSKQYVGVNCIHILDCGSQSSSANNFCIDRMYAEDNSDYKDLFEHSMDSDDEGVKFKF